MKLLVLPEFIAFSNGENKTETNAQAAKVASLYQHTCYIARYLGSPSEFALFDEAAPRRQLTFDIFWL